MFFSFQFKICRHAVNQWCMYHHRLSTLTFDLRSTHQVYESSFQVTTCTFPELRSCVKVEVAVLGSSSLLSLIMVSVGVKQHKQTCTFPRCRYRQDDRSCTDDWSVYTNFTDCKSIIKLPSCDLFKLLQFLASFAGYDYEPVSVFEWILSVIMRTDICVTRNGISSSFNTSQEFPTASYVYYLNIFVTESEIIIMRRKVKKVKLKMYHFSCN